MPARYFQYGDYDNTILRKLLENESQVIGGALSATIRDGSPATAVAECAQTGDTDNNLLRKILVNQALVIGGGLRMSIR